MSDSPNVIYLTVDALRTDRTNIFSYDRPTTPALSRLAERGLSCQKCYSLGPVTQMALIQLLTATRPLSFGGYDFGATGRPPNVFKVFQDAGYETHCLSTLHWVNRFFGYTQGIDYEYQLFGIITIPGVVFAIVKATLQAFQEGKIDTQEMLVHVDPVLSRAFKFIGEYCKEYDKHYADLKKFFPHSSLMNSGYDLHQVQKITSRHEQEYLKDKVAYIHKYFIPIPVDAEWMQRWLPKDWHYARTGDKLAKEAISKIYSSLVSVFDADRAMAIKNRHKIYVDARSITDKIIDVIKNSAKEKKPFFAWTHYLDTHLPYVSGGGPKWYKETPEFLSLLGYDSTYPPALTFQNPPANKVDEQKFSALYDAAVLSTETEIMRILDAVDALGIADNTIIAVAGDHGEELGEFGHFGHFFRLNKQATHVPCVISAPGMKASKYNDFSTIMDIAPTLVSLANIPVPDEWEGKSLVAENGCPQEHILIETFYAGNCLFEHRPLYFGVRTSTYFYLWREYIDPADNVANTRCELYDLRTDPESKYNIYDDNHPALPKLDGIIITRMKEIHEISEERILKAFPNVNVQS